MNKRVLIRDCIEKTGEEVTVAGWVHTVRKHGKIAFFDLMDRSATLQITCLEPSVVEKASRLDQQDVVSVSGIVKKRDERYVNTEIPTGAIELEAKDIQVIAKAHPMPFDMGGKELQLELPTLFDHRSLTLRHPNVKPIFTVQAALLEGFRKAAMELDCTEIVVPTIAQSTTEGGAEVFMIDYFGHKAFLTQSPQLYKQMLIPVFERVWTIAHAYRAEPSVTTRHLTETTQMDLEFGFVDFDDLLNLLEEVAIKMVRFTEEACKDIFIQYKREPLKLDKTPRLTLREAQEIIFKETGRDNRKEKDLTPQDEVDICVWASKHHNSDFVTITHFPTFAKPFYTMPDPKDPEYSLSYDLLFKGVEVLSGSQRINDYDQLVSSIKSRGMNPKAFEMYLQAFQYGMPEEGGFSFGLERLTWKMLGLSNIREASLYPRDMERIDERLSQKSQ